MKTGKINIPLLTLSSSMHLMVDAICVCCLYLMAVTFSVPFLAAVFVTYNITAFLTQPITGLYIDKVGNSHWPLIGAVALLCLGAALVYFVNGSFELQHSPVAVFSVALLIGIGNSLFHVWGGKQTVLKNGNDPRPLGVFVSTGAFGLAIAYVFFSWKTLIILLFAICAATMAYILLDKQKKEYGLDTSNYTSDDSNYAPMSMKTATIVLAVIGIALFVFIRSFVGEWFSGSIIRTNKLILIIGFTAMTGKMAGGWMMKHGGIIPSVCVMIAGTLICLALKGMGNTVCLIGLFMINCTMPVTLYLANYVLKGREALAFGILAAALMPGYILSQII